MSADTTFTGSQQEWSDVHQPWELRYHQHGNFRWPGREESWNEQWSNVFRFAGLDSLSFTPANVILDVGCGSRPVLDYFTGGQKFFIDPLLDDYRKIPQMMPYWSRHADSALISTPAEVLHPCLVGRCDFVLCWNVLDHSYDPFRIVANIHSNAKPGAPVLIGTDLHERPHLGHPGVKNKAEFLAFIGERFRILKNATRGAFKNCREIALLLEKL